MIFEQVCVLIVVYIAKISPFIYIIYHTHKIDNHGDKFVRGVAENITGMSVLCCLMLFIYQLFVLLQFLMSVK